MSYKQYIFCLETTNKAITDWLYIHKVIDYLNNGKQTFDSYKPLYMGGKGNYNSKSFVNKLKQNINMFKGESIVIYCIDLDDYHINPNTNKNVDNVEKYCIENGYRFVYFSRDIEEVFLGYRPESNQKIKLAAKFTKNNIVTSELLDRLNKETKAIKTSNLITIIKNDKRNESIEQLKGLSPIL